jgi:two-component system, LytTR family, response regulator
VAQKKEAKMIQTPIRAIIVEDEEHSRSRLRRLLGNWRQEILIVGEAQNGPEALAIIDERHPDLIFLDIELPGIDGLAVLERLAYQPAVIFTTAYDKYALDAFKAIAIDYLLKPIDEDSLEKAIQKLKKVGYRQDRLVEMFDYLMLSTPSASYKKIPCKVGDKIDLVDPDNVLYFQSDNKYTIVKTIDREYVMDTPLTEIEGKMNPKSFMRIHRGTIVNLEWVAEIRKWDDGRLKLHLRDPKKTELIASRSYTSKLIDW